MRKPDLPERLYLDFDSFFASAEQQMNPALQGKPVGVVPHASEFTSLIAVSREGKRLGLKTGTPVREARERCPQIIIVEARPDEYVKLHHKILDAIDTVVPIGDVRSIDELVCRLLPSESRQAANLALAIKGVLCERFGPVLTCSIGVAPNELLAKIAAEIDKPDGLVVVRPEDIPHRFLKLGLRDLPGIAAGVEARLNRSGITTVEQLWQISPKQGRAIWGSVEGERFIAGLQGYAIEKQETKRRMFGHGRVLPRDWRQPDKILQCARLLCMSASRRLRKEHYRAGALVYGWRIKGQETVSLEGVFPPSRDDHCFLACLSQLHRRMLLQNRLRPADFKLVKNVHIYLHNLSGEVVSSHDLFDEPEQKLQQQRWEQVSDTLDRVRKQFGADALSLGPSNAPGSYIGGKIAFGRIPDLDDY
ncbi:Y-family DNA polymerase [Pseudochrobactrum sp. MP213Fo]|uniref:Y-family DNA polymerase n=1 Tax=Pseudochrobactrum sp. MP213Fo TaxID=3022250 RepID=UPI003BA15768